MIPKSTLRLLLGLFGLLLLLLSFQLTGLPSGLEQTRVVAQNVPIEFVYPAGSEVGAGAESRPLVLIAHGFAGTPPIMRGFAYTIAKAGFVAASWYSDGHGANPNPMPDGCCEAFISNARIVVAEAQKLGLGDTSRIAILGHSLGSGVALTYGQAFPETQATIAVSPVKTSVTPELPHNLLLMAGSREPWFAANARDLLAQAGGTFGQASGNPSDGTARDMLIVPGVEHISILFAPFSHQAAADWLDQTFGAQPGSAAYTDRRILGYALGILGAVLAALMLVPATASQPHPSSLPAWRRVLALAAGALAATLALYALGLVGLDLSRAFNLQVGGYLLCWFGAAGLAALLLLKEPSRPGNSSGWSWLGWPGWKTVGCGVLVAAFLWVGMGLLGGRIFLHWLLISQRLVFYPLAVFCLLPWALAAGQAVTPARPIGRLGWWLASSLCMVGGLLLAILLSPNLLYIGLILPLFPAFLAAHAVAAGRQRSAWAFALGGALFLSWVVLAVFPLG